MKILALDIGTSSAKAAVFDEHGELRTEIKADYPVDELGNGFVEQDPERWWSATCDTTRQLSQRHDIGLVSLAGTMQNVIPLGRAGNILHPAILYSDSRAHEEFDSVRGDLEAACAPELLGNLPNPQMSLAKSIWLRRHKPAIFGQIHKLHFGAKDYVSFRFTDQHVIDPTCASTTGLLDVRHREWSAILVSRLAGLRVSQLPDIRSAAEIIGSVTEIAARQSGLKAGTPVVNGCGDVGAATLGAACPDQDRPYIYLGTSGWVAKSVAIGAPKLSAEIYRLVHPVGMRDIQVSPFLTGGSGAQWFASVLGGAKALSDLDRSALAVDASPPDAMFLPYLYGERGPFNDPLVRGAFVNLDSCATASVLYYSVLEGVAFAIRNNRDALGCSGSEISLIGGAAVSSLWLQLIADSLEMAVHVGQLPASATASGALSLALVAAGLPAYEPRFDLTILPRRDRCRRNLVRWQTFLQATKLARSIASPVSPACPIDAAADG